MHACLFICMPVAKIVITLEKYTIINHSREIYNNYHAMQIATH